MNVVVVGAGIGGLVAARALGQRGHTVVVLERAPAFRPVGAGIILGANAFAVLHALGIDPRPAGRKLARMDITDAAGGVLSPLVLPEGPLGEVYAFHRAELHDVLVAALPASVTVRLGVGLSALTVAPDGVMLDLGGETLHADVVIGADGLHSRVRAAVHPDAEVRYSGQTCWRAVVDAPSLSGVVEAWGPDGVRFGVVPLRDGRAYLFLVAPAPAGAPMPAWEDFSARYAAFQGSPAEVWPSVRPEALVHHDLDELARPVWGTPRAWLLGDAAHAMTPNLGQGAAMAIEDAGALALTFGPDLDRAHAAYVEARRARVAKVHGDSARMGQVAAVANPALRWLRDTVFRFTPASVGARVQAELVGPGLALAERIGASTGG